jgi:DNA-binding XRE family transcriptional regulator
MEQKINKLKGYRAMANLSQKEMSERTGINERTYQNKENGVSELTLSEATNIVRVLNECGIDITISDLM